MDSGAGASPVGGRAARLRRGLATVAIAASLAASADPALGQQRTLVFERFHTDLTVLHDGRMTVSENITVHFTGTWNGIYRTIPVEYRTPYGANYTLFLDVQSITDDAGNSLRYEASRSGANRVFRIWVPGASDATRTVVLRYTVRNGIRFFDEHDELYWNVTGDESEFPITSASASIYLPAEVTGIRSTAYTGAFGSTGQDATIRETGNLVEIRTNRPLRFREGLTAVVGWDPGVVERPSRLEKARDFLASNLAFLFPVLAVGLMSGAWRRWGRDPKLGSIVPRFEPPGNLRPAEVGTLIDGRPDMRDVTASLVDLAVRGFMIIEETEEKQLFGLIHNRVFSFELRGDPGDPSLRPFEHQLLDALFEGGTRNPVTTKDLENSFYRDLPGIRSSLSDTLTRDGHYLRKPSSVRALWVAVAVASAFAVAVIGSVMAARRGQQPGPAFVAAALTALVVAGFGMLMPARTLKGTRTLAEILGFEEFLSRVEKDRLDRMVRTPEMFERLLPYAMVFGVEKRWANAFADIYREPPQWYRGTGPHVFIMPDFTHSLGQMTAATGTAMRSAPRSSGSSGFGGGGFGGGGGFSGGGFGGGGVGGF